jgi:hypothetical protein
MRNGGKEFVWKGKKKGGKTEKMHSILTVEMKPGLLVSGRLSSP